MVSEYSLPEENYKIINMSREKIIIDTDIGDDIDDALAIGLALNSLEIELIGITTVFKNTVARAKIAKKLLQIAGIKRIERIGDGSQ